jgi:hypothetical protein
LIHLVLSLDYEIFGNGSGDVQRDMIEPTERILNICERYDAKMTIMFEVGEYWAFERFDRQLGENLGYAPCERMRQQVLDAMARGHDVQLHLHPQWIGAQYDQGRWQFSHSHWRLADLPGGLGSAGQTASIIGALHRGKGTLEAMIRPVRPGYECACFRAGGFYAQPSQDIIHAMKTVGLKADSSVVKGFRIAAPFAVDYSCVKTARAAWWTTDTELTLEGTPGEHILELPVSSRMEPYWRSLRPVKLRAALHRRQAGRPSHNGHGNDHGNGNGPSSVPSCRTVLKKMLTQHASTFDFCKLSCRDMLQRIQELDNHQPQPVVMVGHSKDFVNDRHFDEFLAALSRRKTVCFMSMSEIIQDAWRKPGGARPMQSADAGPGRSET